MSELVELDQEYHSEDTDYDEEDDEFEEDDEEVEEILPRRDVSSLLEEAKSLSLSEFRVRVEELELNQDEFNSLITKQVSFNHGEEDMTTLLHYLVNNEKYILIECADGNKIEIHSPKTREEIFSHFMTKANVAKKEFGVPVQVQMSYYNAAWKPKQFNRGKVGFSYPGSRLKGFTLEIDDFIYLKDWTPYYHATDKFNSTVKPKCYYDHAFQVFGPIK